MFWDLLNILTNGFSQRCKRLIPPATYSGRNLSDLPLRSQQLWGLFPDDMVSVIALWSPLHFLSLPSVLCPVSNQFVPVPSRNVRGWKQARKIFNGPCLYKPHTTASLSLIIYSTRNVIDHNGLLQGGQRIKTPAIWRFCFHHCCWEKMFPFGVWHVDRWRFRGSILPPSSGSEKCWTRRCVSE